MVHFVGAGSGAVDLITVRGARLLKEADVVIYAGSLVNPEILRYTGENCRIYNSAEMTLEEVLEVIETAERSERLLYACIPAIPAFMGLYVSNLTLLTRLALLMMSVPASVHSAARRHLCGQNILCRM